MNGHKKERATHPVTRPVGSVIIDFVDKYNPVMRIGALSEGVTEKAALGRRYRNRVRSGQSEIPKVPGQHSNRPMLWGCHPPLPADRWIPMGIYVLQRHGPIYLGHFADHARTTPSRHCPTVGARTDRPKRCTVNTAERASGLIRFTSAGFPCDVALTGERTLPKKRDGDLTFQKMTNDLIAYRMGKYTMDQLRALYPTWKVKDADIVFCVNAAIAAPIKEK